ncbi:hypothetical protein GCM10009797_08440 [Nocardioides hwasunensis]
MPLAGIGIVAPVIGWHEAAKAGALVATAMTGTLHAAARVTLRRDGRASVRLVMSYFMAATSVGADPPRTR